MNLLKAATLLVASPDASADRYARWFDYERVEEGVVDAALAESWGAPATAGKRHVLCRPASGANTYLRFVAGDTPAAYMPLRTFGWAALELCVSDVLAVEARLHGAPFEIIGRPRLLDSMPEIYPMQVRGPDREIVYLTEIRGDQPGIVLPRAQSLVDQLFILVAGCSDVAASFAWLRGVLGLHVGVDAQITYTMLARAFDLPPEYKHRIITGVHGHDCFLEFDQYPEAAVRRDTAQGQLPPGVALATLTHPDLAALEGPWMSAPAPREGAMYAGARSGVLRGPDGLLVELVETP